MTPLLLVLAIFAFTLPLPLLLQLLIAAVLPLLVGLVTNRVTRSSVKAILLLVLSIVSAGLVDLLASVKADRPFDAGLWLITAVGTFLASGAFHFILWKPTGVAAAAQNAMVATQRSPSSSVSGSSSISRHPQRVDPGGGVGVRVSRPGDGSLSTGARDLEDDSHDGRTGTQSTSAAGKEQRRDAHGRFEKD